MSWTASHKSPGTLHYGVYDERGALLAHLQVSGPVESNRRWDEARLMAAAPDLLEVARTALTCIERSTEFNIGNPAYEQAQARLGAAIAKATGEQQ